MCSFVLPKTATTAIREVLRQLLDAFRRHSTRFIGGGQHDSHDCLIHFLNDLRDEERSCTTAPIPGNV